MEEETLNNNDVVETSPAEYWKTKYLYLAADFENYKRQQTKVMNDYRIYKNKDIIRNLLDIVDDFERALTSSPGDKGMWLIYSKMMKVLENEGLSEIEIKTGDAFNDDTMNCVYTSHVFNEEENNTVNQVTKKGYKYKDYTLRYADVIVNKMES